MEWPQQHERSTALRAGTRRACRAQRLGLLIGGKGKGGTDEVELVATVGVQEPVVANALEAARQDMLEKTRKEALGAKWHVVAGAGVVLV